MLGHFGWRAAAAIVVSNGVYFMLFRRELLLWAIGRRCPTRSGRRERRPRRGPPLLPVPAGSTLVHVAFIAWTVVNAHYPALFVGGFLFFLGFVKATAAFQTSCRAALADARRLLSRGTGHSRGAAGLVDCASAREPVRGTVVLRRYALDGLQRQRADHVPLDARAESVRVVQDRRGARARSPAEASRSSPTRRIRLATPFCRSSSAERFRPLGSGAGGPAARRSWRSCYFARSDTSADASTSSTLAWAHERPRRVVWPTPRAAHSAACQVGSMYVSLY